jgi:hypothetical protein
LVVSETNAHTFDGLNLGEVHPVGAVLGSLSRYKDRRLGIIAERKLQSCDNGESFIATTPGNLRNVQVLQDFRFKRSEVSLVRRHVILFTKNCSVVAHHVSPLKRDSCGELHLRFLNIHRCSIESLSCVGQASNLVLKQEGLVL